MIIFSLVSILFFKKKCSDGINDEPGMQRGSLIFIKLSNILTLVLKMNLTGLIFLLLFSVAVAEIR